MEDQAVIKCRVFLFIPIVFIFLLVFSNENFAQISNSVSKVNFGTAIEGQPLTVNVELLPVSNISDVRIAYRLFEEREFKIREMELVGTSASFTIPPEDVRLPYITYYLIIGFSDGTSETYPLGVPDAARPLEKTIRGASPKDQEVVILSPAPAETVALEDLFVSISLIKASDNVDVQATRVFIKGVDITEYVLFAGDLILFYANNFPEIVTPGKNSLKVELYDKEGNLYHTVESSFETRRKDALIRTVKDFAYSGMINAESRREEYSGSDEWFNNVSMDFDGNYKDWNFGAYAYVTSEESDELQAQNRFSAAVNYQSWFRLKAGDAYPRYSEIVMNGKRVRGVSGSLNFGTFNIQSSYGRIYRGVEGRLLQTYSRDEAPLESNVILIDSSKHNNPYGLISPGTFKRNLFVVRPSFGSGRNFQWGLTYLHGKDDMNSIEFGAKPKENVLAGTDLKFALDDQRIIFNGQAAVSLLNTDISPGELSDAQIDSIYSDDNSALGGNAEDFKNLRDQVGRFITFNQYIGPLNPDEFSSLAAEASLQFNYFDNNLRASYKYRGNDYYSFGNDYLRTDLKGFNLSDRIRLARNQVFVTLSFEKLQDNLQNTKPATTNFQTVNTSVSYFPREDLPAVTVGYSYYRNDNDITTDASDELRPLAIDDNTNRFILTLSYDVKYGIDHATSLNITSSNRDDKTFNNRDSKYLSASLSVNSYWQRNLTTTLYLMYYDSEIASLPYSYFTLSAGAQYKMLQDKLNLSLSLSPSLGDFERLAVDFVGQYLLMENLRLILQLRYYRTKNQIPDDGSITNYLSYYNNSIAGLTVRYTL
jgi:hypothetical protein